MTSDEGNTTEDIRHNAAVDEPQQNGWGKTRVWHRSGALAPTIAGVDAANEDEEKDLFGSDGGRACRPTG